jgi:hypothetical protein
MDSPAAELVDEYRIFDGAQAMPDAIRSERAERLPQAVGATRFSSVGGRAQAALVRIRVCSDVRL